MQTFAVRLLLLLNTIPINFMEDSLSFIKQGPPDIPAKTPAFVSILSQKRSYCP